VARKAIGGFLGRLRKSEIRKISLYRFINNKRS